MLTERMPRKTKTIVFLLAIAIFVMIITTITPQFTGYVVQDPNSYEVLILNQNFSSNKQLDLPFNEPLTSLHATGSIIGSGTLEIILSNGTENYTVYSLDTYSANQLSGFVTKDTKTIVPISSSQILSKNITNNSIEKLRINESEKYLHLFTDHCQDTCYLPSIKNITLYINMDGNISLHLQDLSYQLIHPVKQYKKIDDQIIIANDVVIINFKDYFKNYNSLVFSLPKIVGMDAKIINKHQLLLTGNNSGDYGLFVYATNGKELFQSNEFVLSILPAKNTTSIKTE